MLVSRDTPHPSGDSSASTGPVALVGSTGFVGSGVLHALLESDDSVCVLTRSYPNPISGVQTITAPTGLDSEPTIRELLNGARAVIHAASYTGEDEGEQYRTNVVGTSRLLKISTQLHIPRFIYVSTCGVYGDSLQPGMSEDEVAPNPQSALSKSRYAAETIVRENGGIIVRPHFILGRGDRWVIPTYLQLVRRYPALAHVEGGRTSFINRKRLGQIVTMICQARTLRHDLYHVADPQPTSARTVLRTIAGLSPLLGQEKGPTPRPVRHERAVLPEVLRSKARFLLEDTWVSTARLTSELVEAKSRFGLIDAEDAEWYRETYMPNW